MSDEIGFGEDAGRAGVATNDDQAYAGAGKRKRGGLQCGIDADHRETSGGSRAEIIDAHDILLKTPVPQPVGRRSDAASVAQKGVHRRANR
jgi:hypothetical protein